MQTLLYVLVCSVALLCSIALAAVEDVDHPRSSNEETGTESQLYRRLPPMCLGHNLANATVAETIVLKWCPPFKGEANDPSLKCDRASRSYRTRKALFDVLPRPGDEEHPVVEYRIMPGGTLTSSGSTTVPVPSTTVIQLCMCSLHNVPSARICNCCNGTIFIEERVFTVTLVASQQDSQLQDDIAYVVLDPNSPDYRESYNVDRLTALQTEFMYDASENTGTKIELWRLDPPWKWQRSLDVMIDDRLSNTISARINMTAV